MIAFLEDVKYRATSASDGTNVDVTFRNGEVRIAITEAIETGGTGNYRAPPHASYEQPLNRKQRRAAAVKNRTIKPCASL